MKAFFIPLALLPLLFAPAHAGAGDATVHLDLNVFHLDYKDCNVTVPVGSDGAAVLDAAVASGCISSWSGTTYDFGTFVDCIDGICSAPPTYWAMSLNGVSTDYGISDYGATNGDVLGFDYVQWVVAL